MPAVRALWRESWRVLVYTLAVALAFIAFGRFQLQLFGGLASTAMFGQAGLYETAPDAALLEQAAQVASRSQSASSRLPAGHRVAALRMGYEIGYASHLIGSVAMSDQTLQDKVRWLAGKHIEVAQLAAQHLGVPPEGSLTTRKLQQFTDLHKRIEDDETGAAARIEERLSPLHRHLFLLGAHLGNEHARIETSGGELLSPPARLIRRHATLAGIELALWQPLIVTPSGETPEQTIARYRDGLARLATWLQQPA